MASLQQAVKDFQDELRDGMAWVIFWREGRSWQSDYLYLELGSDTIPYDDVGKLQQIAKLDPRAVALNGYYCGHLAEDMSIDELVNGVRWHYENGFNSLAGFIEQHDGTIPPEQIEEARQIAHAAGLPFSARPYDGQDSNPYIYDGSMTPEDYELMQKRIAAERSDRMEEEKGMNYLEAYISNLGKHAEGQPMGEWVQFPTTPEHLKEVFDRIGIDGKQYREWQITEYHSDLSRLVKHLGKRESLDELNYLGKLLEMQFDGDREKFVAAVEHGEYAGSVKDLINLAQNLDCYWLYPNVQSEEDYGRYLIDELDELELPEEAKKYFMYEDYGRDAVIKDKGRFTEQGYIYNNQNTFTEWYDGRDMPQEYRVTPEFPQPERGDPEKADMDAVAIGGAQAAAPDAPRPVIPIILSSTDKKERVKEITGHLELGIQDVFESDRYKNYLTTLSKHHTYSFNNTMLIAMQGGHFVKGYSQWQKEFGRHVMENQKSIKILAPSPYKVKRHVQKIDPETNAPLLDKDGKPIMEEKEITIPDYKVVSVFDVSQTEGKEMPPLTLTRPLIGDVEQYEDFFAAIEKASPFPIGFEQLDGGGRGVCLYDERRIAINEGMSQLQNVKTAIHETTHAKLHDIGSDILSENTDRPDKRTREVQAESIAYAVCQYFGLDTSDYSFAYLAEWSSGKELTELKSSLETIQQTAKELITEIEGHFFELQQSREVAAPQQDEATPEIAQEAPVTEAAPDLAAEPTVTILWSESSGVQDGQTMPLSEADKLFTSLDEAKHAEYGGVYYDKTKFRIDYVMDGETHHYEGRQDFGDGDGGLIGHIEKYHAYYADNPEWDNYVLRNEGKEALEADKAQREILLQEFVPYLKLHCNLSEMEQAAQQAMGAEARSPGEAAFYDAMQKYVAECRGMLNQGDYHLPPAPQREDFDPDLQSYRQRVMDEIAQEAASAGMTVEEYAANGYEPHAPAPEATQDTANEPQTTLFDKLPPEQQQALSDTVKDTLQTLIDADKRIYGDVTGKTLEAIAAQGFTYRDGQLEKQQPEPQPMEAGSPATPYYSINEAAARRANDMNSLRDYKPGSATAAYRQAVDEAAAIAKRQKERVDPMYHDKIDSLLDTYARKLAENMNKSYTIEGRVASILVAGGSNFPVAKKHKQNAARDKNMEEWRDIQGLLDKIRSTGMGGISADDPQAIPKLEKKLAGLEKAQETMKAVNAYYRKHKTLDGCPHLTPEQIEQAKAQMSNGWRVEDKPYPTWALSNNNAEIRRVKERIASLTKKSDTPFVGWEFDGGRVEANKADNRLQIFFDDKPDADTRAELKSGGFRWSPNAGAWQRQLNSNAYYAANGISAIQPLTGEKPTVLQRAYVREQQAQPEATPDGLMTGETVRTPRGNFYITDMSREQIEAAGYGFHHASDDGKYLIMGNGTRAFAIAAQQPERDNPLKAAEQTVEQNENMIDGIINNTPQTPTVADLEQRAKAGEAISVTDLAKAVQAEKGKQPPQKKTSILKKLDEYKKQAAQQPKKQQQKEQNKDLEV